MSSLIPALLEPQPVLDVRGRSVPTVLAIVTGRHLLHHLAQYPRVATACLLTPWLAPLVWVDSLSRHYVDAAAAAQSVSDAMDSR